VNARIGYGIGIGYVVAVWGADVGEVSRELMFYVLYGFQGTEFVCVAGTMLVSYDPGPDNLQVWTKVWMGSGVPGRGRNLDKLESELCSQ
jgi:hypothetical protein